MKSIVWVIAEIVMVFILLSMPGNQFPDTTSIFHDYPIDKIVHVILFGSLVYSFLFYFEQSKSKILKTVRAKALTILICVVYGIAMEFYQKYFVPSRGFEVTDMLADAAGAILALPVFNFMQKRKNR